MTRAETLAAIKEETSLGGEFEWCDCERISECPRCAIAWLLQEIEYLQQGTVAYMDRANAQLKWAERRGHS